MLHEEIESIIRTVPDFPKPGIMFKDITPLLENPDISRKIINEFVKKAAPLKPDAIAGVESRGFLFGMPLAVELGIPFILIRKKGKLPYHKISFAYDLEYGTAEVEMHVDSVKPGMNVLIHDDLLATGGTALAAAELIKMQGGSVAGFAFLVELAFLNGASRLAQESKNIINLVAYS